MGSEKPTAIQSLTAEIVTELAKLPEGQYVAEILFRSHGDGKTLDVENLVVLNKDHA